MCDDRALQATVESFALKKPADSKFYTWLFCAALIYSATPWSSPAIALMFGVTFGLLNLNRWGRLTAFSSKWMLKASVVGLGFGMNIHSVLETGEKSFVYTGVGIAAALLAGLALGRLLEVSSRAAFLVSVGTAICGGSAIAAVSPLIGADDEETAVSLSTVFLLNGIALFAFPAIAGLLGLSQTQFGLWAAMAIHDTSSVVGAGMRYGPSALAIATTVKLVRALWIVPVTVITAIFLRARGKVTMPWFIGFFLCAAWVRSIWPAGDRTFNLCVGAARAGLAVTLFCIGSSLSLAAVRRIGWRTLAQGVVLWMVVLSVSLFLVWRNWIGL